MRPSSPVFVERSHAHYPAWQQPAACFFATRYGNYLEWSVSTQARQVAGFRLCVMTNHVHLLISAEEGGSSGALMKAVGHASPVLHRS